MASTFAAVWRDGAGPQKVLADGSLADFEANDEAFRSQGLRLVALETHTDGGRRLWAAVWREGSGAQKALVDGSLDDLTAHDETFRGQDLRLVALQSYTDGGRQLWAAVWREGSGAQKVLVNGSLDDFEANDETFRGQGLRLVVLQSYADGGRQLWAAVWREGSGAQKVLVNGSLDDFEANDEAFRSQGLRLVVLQSYADGGRQLWAAVWREGSGAQKVLVNGSLDDFEANDEAFRGQGLRLVALDVSGAPALNTVVLHLRVLNQPRVELATMVRRMQEVYQTAGIDVQVRAALQVNAPDLVNLQVGECVMGAVTEDQERLFALRDGVGPKEIVAYFVHSTIPPFNGCAAHPVQPDDQPGAVIAQEATEWTLAHEIGHVLDLIHVEDDHRLMTGNGTANIIPPPLLDPTEIQTMLKSRYIIKS